MSAVAREGLVPNVSVRIVPAVFQETVGLVPNVWLPERPSLVSTLLPVIVEVAIVSENVKANVSVAENCVEPSTSLHERELKVGAVMSYVTFEPDVILA